MGMTQWVAHLERVLVFGCGQHFNIVEAAIRLDNMSINVVLQKGRVRWYFIRHGSKCLHLWIYQCSIQSRRVIIDTYLHMHILLFLIADRKDRPSAPSAATECKYWRLSGSFAPDLSVVHGETYRADIPKHFRSLRREICQSTNYTTRDNLRLSISDFIIG